jgi:hypothetical protein
MRTKLSKIAFMAINALTATFSFSKKKKEKLRFGVRIALGKYALPNIYDQFVYGFCRDYVAGRNMDDCRTLVSKWGESFGQFYEIGAIAAIPIINTITFNPGFSVIYRKDNQSYSLSEIEKRENFIGFSEYWQWNVWAEEEFYYDRAEWAISIPVFFQGMPFGGPLFYLEGGFLLELPFIIHDIGDELGIYGEEENGVIGYKSSGRRDQRTKMDLGLVLGFGWNINEHFAVDSRNFVNLVDREDFFFLFFGLGLNYLF